MQQEGWHSSNDSNSSLELSLMSRVTQPATCGAKLLKALKDSWMTITTPPSLPYSLCQIQSFAGYIEKRATTLAGPARSQ